MSDVVVPSFFPTPTEIAGGLRWVKQHPVVATAAACAATAVSVLTYLKAAAEDERKFAVQSRRKTHERDDLCSSTESDASTLTRDRNPSPRNLSFEELDAEAEDVTETVENSELEAALNQADGETISPQWGWYVSTTPPEEYYQ